LPEKKFAVEAGKIFLKSLDTFPRAQALAIVSRLKMLETSPFPTGNNPIKKLKGFLPPVYRMRIGDKRILYRVTGDTVVLLKAVSRKDLEKELRNLPG
jgi:mRNA-degrading endonuclease RelE of RelBE toxin-antitoxin system